MAQPPPRDLPPGSGSKGGQLSDAMRGHIEAFVSRMRVYLSVRLVWFDAGYM